MGSEIYTRSLTSERNIVLILLNWTMGSEFFLQEWINSMRLIVLILLNWTMGSEKKEIDLMA